MSTKMRASAKAVLGSLTAGKKDHEDGTKDRTQREAEHQDQRVPEPQPAVPHPQGQPEAASDQAAPAQEDVVKDQTLEAQHQEQAVTEPQAGEQNGKAPLPPDEAEEVPDDEDDIDEDDQDFEDEDAEDREEESVFTDQDKADLMVQEGKFNDSGMEQARAIIEIRQRRLWMQHRVDDDPVIGPGSGSGPRKYKTFDQYVDERWGHTRQWVSQLTKSLKANEQIAKLGLHVCLSANAANGLWQLDAAGGYQGSTQEEQEENGLVAVIQEAQEDGLSLSRDNVRAICDRRSNYFRAKKNGSHPPAAATYAEYKQDCILVNQLAKGGSFGVVKEAKELPGDFADNLLKLCSDQQKWPRAEDLLEAITGHDLEIIIPRINTIAQEVADAETKKNLLKTRRAEIRAMQQGGALAQLKEEAKALQTELEQKGLIKKRGGKKKDDAGDGSQVQQGEETDKEGGDDSQIKQAEDAGDEGDVEDGGEEEPNEVQGNLDTALECLEAALEAEWPEGGDMIQAILKSAQACECKLAELSNKANELLADVDTPLKVISVGILPADPDANKPLKISVGVLPPEKIQRMVKPLDPSDPDSF